MTTGPAPTLRGETVTDFCVITPVSCNGTGGRGLFLKSLPPPHPAIAVETAATVRTRSVCRLTLIPRAGNLSEPDGGAACDEPVDFALDLPAHPLGDVLHDREVFRVFGSIFREINGFKEPNLEFCGHIHGPGGESCPRKRVIDREIDQPGETLERADVGEDRHRLLGADHGDRDDRDAGTKGGLYVAAAAEAT